MSQICKSQHSILPKKKLTVKKLPKAGTNKNMMSALVNSNPVKLETRHPVILSLQWAFSGMIIPYIELWLPIEFLFVFRGI